MHSLANRLLGPARAALLAQFLRFAVAGGVGFVVDNAVVYGTRHSIGLYWGGAAAYILAATANWLVNRHWAFRGQGSASAPRQWALFLATNLLGFALNRGTYFALITVSPLAAREPVLAILAGTAAGMFLNFFFARRVVFR